LILKRRRENTCHIWSGLASGGPGAWLRDIPPMGTIDIAISKVCGSALYTCLVCNTGKIDRKNTLSIYELHRSNIVHHGAYLHQRRFSHQGNDPPSLMYFVFVHHRFLKSSIRPINTQISPSLTGFYQQRSRSATYQSCGIL
jgi:hypothetical protein